MDCACPVRSRGPGFYILFSILLSTGCPRKTKMSQTKMSQTSEVDPVVEAVIEAAVLLQAISHSPGTQLDTIVFWWCATKPSPKKWDKMGQKWDKSGTKVGHTHTHAHTPADVHICRPHHPHKHQSQFHHPTSRTGRLGHHPESPKKCDIL